ncbi:nucleotidyltransferase domain-containing protein [Arthrobacter sp. lap29]|uniref:nucleotidyltransferase domain-containing protein n=1 Tax=Arthrobacter sp. lap29 TaxID=3056122 RepID=UPI0028F71486|nr:nucleotidyltransferase domain-containing protein [Arthrobacter sp. lap29]
MPMAAATPVTIALRELLNAHCGELLALLAKHAATNPKIFGSIVRGTAREGSDIDPFPVHLLKQPISESALSDAVAL